MPTADCSVIIPTHNRCEVLLRALSSVQAQTLPAREIIVVDDGSTDDTAQRVANEFPQVTVHRQPQRGVSAARNAGIALARGAWIALLDSDDEWLPEKLASQFQAIETADSSYRLCHSDEIWIRNGVRVNPMKKHQKRGGDIFKHCLPLCCISPSSVLLHRTLLQEHGGFDEQLPACEDYDLWLKVCAREPVLYVDQFLIRKYGGHEDQLSQKYWGMDRFRLRALARLLDQAPLNAEQRAQATQTLCKKARVFAKGAAKHGRPEEAEQYFQMAEHYQNLQP